MALLMFHMTMPGVPFVVSGLTREVCECAPSWDLCKMARFLPDTQLKRITLQADLQQPL